MKPCGKEERISLALYPTDGIEDIFSGGGSMMKKVKGETSQYSVICYVKALETVYSEVGLCLHLVRVSSLCIQIPFIETPVMWNRL